MVYEISSSSTGLELDPSSPSEIQVVRCGGLDRKLDHGTVVLQLGSEKSYLTGDLSTSIVCFIQERGQLTLTIVPMKMFAMARSCSFSLR